MRPGRNHQRGQATVETALGLLVFITILVFGLHFAEMAQLSIKLREATAGAMWDATSKKMHNLPKDFAPLDSAIAGAGGLATRRYEDFDGRTSRDLGRSVTQVFTGGTALTVSCGPDSTLSFAPPAVKSGVLKDAYLDKGGMACSARATLFAWQFPQSFLDDGTGALFKASHKSAPMNLCAPGRGGARCGTSTILLDDWGLAGPEESVPNILNVCTERYCRTTRTVFDANGGVQGGAVEAMSRWAVNGVPSMPQFWLSFRGDDRRAIDPPPFTEPLKPPFPMDWGERTSWPTTPGLNSPVPPYVESYNSRTGCFLGGPCG